MTKIAICDDCPQQIESYRSLLLEYQSLHPGAELHTDCFATGSELLVNLEAGQSFDLLLLDIMMPGQNGIELARHIRAMNDDVHIVFLTNSEDYALDAFSVQATQYILKPVMKDALFSVIDRVISSLQQEKDGILLVSSAGRDVNVRFSSIICVESMQRALHIYLTGGSELRSRTIRVPFATAVAPLLCDKRFLHAHKSFVLNMALVEELTGKSFVMKNGIEISIPRYKYSGVKNSYMEYLSAQGISRFGR